MATVRGTGRMIRLLSLFSGIGAFESALRRGGYQFETVNYCEIDPYAAKAYSQIHDIPEEKNLHDVREVNPLLLDNINLVTYGFPCQDISVAGKQKGFEHDGERTRSGLFFEALRIIEFLQPEYAICENVKALTSKKFTAEFQTVLSGLSKAGYNNYWEVLNAKDYGIPQNRERVFIVSIRKDIDKGNFRFPPKQQLKCVAKDFLESVVDDKYYLDNDRVRNLIKQITEKFNIKDRELCDATIFEPEVKSIVNCITARYDAGIQNQKSIGVSVIEPMIKTEGNLYENKAKRGRVYSADGLAPCITSTDYKYPSIFVEPKIKRLGNLYDENAGGARAGNVYDFDGLSPALQTAQGGNRQPIIYKEYKLRKLTPRECFRLMGFTDEEFDRIHNISNTQLYKMAGNSIVVNVLEAIFKQLFKETNKE